MARRLLSLAFSLLLIMTAAAANGSGIVKLSSAYDVATTADRLVNRLKAQDMKVFARIDHAQGAARVKQSLRPTELIIFGNPKVGTPLMQCAQTAALDLPQKALIWRDDAGDVWLAYNDPRYLARRHELQGCDAVLSKIAGALDRFARFATSQDQRLD